MIKKKNTPKRTPKRTPKKKNIPTPLPGLPEGAPKGSFPLAPEEANEFRHVQSERRFLQSEMDKLQLSQQNLFLKIQLRTGQDIEGWGVDVQMGLCIPPESKEDAPPAPPAPPADPPPPTE